MKTTTISAGATGGWAGASMTRTGYDVLLIDCCLNRKGLYIDGVRGELAVPGNARIPDQLKGSLEAFVAATGKVLP